LGSAKTLSSESLALVKRHQNIKMEIKNQFIISSCLPMKVNFRKYKDMKKLTSIVIASIFITGCATSSSDIAPTYVSPLQYKDYDCQQLAAEAQRIQSRVAQVGGRLDQAASNDKMITGAGIVVFWPALFFLGGTKQQEADYARLKGEYDGVQQASIQRRCMLVADDKPKPQSPAASAP